MSIPLLYPNDYTFPDPFYALEECDGVVGISREIITRRGRAFLALAASPRDGATGSHLS